MMKTILLVVFPLVINAQMIYLNLKEGHHLKSIKENKRIVALFKQNGCKISPQFPSRKDTNSTKDIIIICEKNIEGVKQGINSFGISNSIEIDVIPTTLGCSMPINYNDLWMRDSSGNLNYFLDLIEAQCAWSITTGNPNIIISMVDTEFEPNHIDMQGRFAGTDGTGIPSNPHGIQTSGNAVANTNNGRGIAAVGYNCRVFGRRCSGATIGDGVLRAARAGNQIINVSWTSVGLTATQVRDSVISRGCVLVVAAGNDSTQVLHTAYANIPGVIIVGGVNRRNEHAHTGLARNANIDLCAPAIDICTTYPNNGYGQIWRGTSNASPQVAGTIGLMLSANPCLTPAQIEEILEKTADPISDANQFIGLLGTGRLNAYKAVKEAVTRYVQNQTISTATTTRAFVDIGSDVTTTQTNGPVKVAPNSNWTINARVVTIKNDFEVPLGSEFTINTTPTQALGCP